MELAMTRCPRKGAKTTETISTPIGCHEKSAENSDVVSRETPAEKLLARLEGVKRTGPHTWRAKCPTREDRHPSLDIRERSDGALLLIDRAGISSAGDILDAVGLSLSDLFPQGLRAPWYSKPTTPHFDYSGFRDVAREGLVTVALSLADIANGVKISPSDADYLLGLSKRLLCVLDLAGGAR